MDKNRASEIITNFLQSDESKYTAEVDEACALMQEIMCCTDIIKVNPHSKGVLVDELVIKAIYEDFKNKIISILQAEGKPTLTVREFTETMDLIIERM